MSEIPEFETERLILRAPTEEDIPSYQKHFSDWDVLKELTNSAPWPYPDDGVEDYYHNRLKQKQGKDYWTWGIFLKTNFDELMGTISLWREGKPANRGFWLGKEFWGHGYMTEASHRIMDHAFNDLGFKKLCFDNAVGNYRSRRVKIKTGAQLIDTIKKSTFNNPEYTAIEVWEITKEDWEKHLSKESSDPENP